MDVNMYVFANKSYKNIHIMQNPKSMLSDAKELYILI